jgi:hypothetical protein
MPTADFEEDVLRLPAANREQFLNANATMRRHIGH